MEADNSQNEHEIITKDNIKLFSKSFQPSGPAIGTITFVHGFGEHIGRYAHVFPVLCGAGFIVNAFDQRGHGKSGGFRSDTPSIDASLEDINLIAAQASPDLPHFLYGHSMGGGFALLYAQRIKPAVPLAGIIVTDPLIKLYFQVPKLKVVIGRLIAKVAPQHLMYNELRPEALSRDQEVGKAYVADPLVLRNVTTRMGTIMLGMGDWIIADASKITAPILLVHGTADTITSCPTTQEVYEKISSSDKTLKLLEGWFHEPHNEAEKQELFDLILEWLRNHIPVRS